MPDVQVAALAAVVQQAGEHQVGILLALVAQRADDIEAVALVGAVHRVEEAQLIRCQPDHQLGSLDRRDAAAEVAREAANLGRPPAHSPSRTLMTEPARPPMSGAPTRKMTRIST